MVGTDGVGGMEWWKVRDGWRGRSGVVEGEGGRVGGKECVVWESWGEEGGSRVGIGMRRTREEGWDVD